MVWSFDPQSFSCDEQLPKTAAINTLSDGRISTDKCSKNSYCGEHKPLERTKHAVSIAGHSRKIILRLLERSAPRMPVNAELHHEVRRKTCAALGAVLSCNADVVITTWISFIAFPQSNPLGVPVAKAGLKIGRRCETRIEVASSVARADRRGRERPTARFPKNHSTKEAARLSRRILLADIYIEMRRLQLRSRRRQQTHVLRSCRNATDRICPYSAASPVAIGPLVIHTPSPG